MLHPLISPKMLYVYGLICLSLIPFTSASFPYFGTKIGSLKRLHHGVSGDVYAVDSRTIFVKKFNYDGEAPAAYFYVGNTPKPSNEGAYRLRDERGGTAALTRRYRNKDITLSLPEGISLKDIKWFSVWCDEFAVNFGDVTIPSNLDFPRPQKIQSLNGVHDVKSDNIVIVDAQTLLVPNFSYDGEAPDAKFWVGQGDRPSPNGLRIPDENGKEDPLRRYDRKTIVLTLPDDLTIFDIGHFGIWCEAFTVDFGHVRIPKNLNVPPSLKMLGISPQSKLNCEVLYDDKAFEVRWAMAGDSIVVQLVAKLDDNEYMAFGISPDKDRSVMIGSDVAVSWVDRATGKGYAVDYYLEDKSQCSGKRGSCPDVNIDENTNSIRLLNAAMVNGYSIVTYQRSLNATDRLDLPIARNGFEAIVWGIGPLNERKETSFHSHYNKRTHYIDFGRQPTWNCPTPEGQKPGQDDNDDDDDVDEVDQKQEQRKGYPPAVKPARGEGIPEEEFYDNNRAQALQGGANRRQESTNTRLAQRRPVPTPKPVVNENGAWDIPAIQCYEPEDGVFYAQMGPTGGKHGYSAITGHVGWGISWFINGLLIPEIHVVRGKTYTFVVEGGNNPDIPAKYHPFYITDDPVGGYEHKREEEKKNIRIFAGVHRSRSGQVTPTGVGRLCNWTPDIDGPPADDFQSFGAYQRTLTLKCDPGEPGVITWKPDQNTPDTVYYHCFTHRYLGWKIHVHDTCDDARFAASEKHAVRVPAPVAVQESDEQAAEASIRHETKVSPNDNFLLKHQTDLIKNHNMNGTPPKLTFEITKSTEITKLISDGIRAAEALEDSILRQKQQQQQPASGLVNQGLASNFIVNSNTKNLNVNSANGSPSVGISASSSSTSTSSSTIDASKTLPAGSTHSLVPPQQQPHISTNPPETLHGETNLQQYLNSLQSPSQSSPSQSSSLAHNNNRQTPVLLATHLQTHLNTPYNSNHYHLAQSSHHTANNITNNLPLQNSQKPIGLSEFLRPPFNAPLFHPVKLPGRRPYPGPIKKVPASKPILPQQLPRHPPGLGGPIPQPSVIVNHYRKPVPTLLRPFIKDKPFPLQPLAASVLLLGQPTELTNTRKTDNLVHMGKKPIIPVPYADLIPQGSLTKQQYNKNNPEKLKNNKPILIADNIKSFETSTITTKSTNGLNPVGVFKDPFVVQEIKEEPSAAELATMKPAVNEGFKPDTVVVESGFKPILRQDGPIPPPEVVEQIASRREDPGLEIDEAMETDTLFLTSQQQTQTQNFEPMFIPSPPDSTNATIIIRKTSGVQNLHKPQPSNVLQQSSNFLYNKPISSMLKSSMKLPEAAPLRNASLEDILKESNEQEENNNKDEYKADNIQNNLEESTSEGQVTVKQKSNVIKDMEELYPSDEYLDIEDLQSEGKLKLVATTTVKLPNEKSNIPTTTSKETILKLNSANSKNTNNKNDKYDLDAVEFDDDDSKDFEENLNRGRENEDDDDDDYLFDFDPHEAQAAERIDTYYLPPDNRKIPHANIPSGAVITYDGKSVMDSSLVLPPKLDSERDDAIQPRLFNGNGRGLSKLQQLIRSTPQVVPFRGEIPPLSHDLSPETTQRSQIQNNNKYNLYSQSSSQSALSSLRPSQSTKLQIIRNNSN